MRIYCASFHTQQILPIPVSSMQYLPTRVEQAQLGLPVGPFALWERPRAVATPLLSRQPIIFYGVVPGWVP